MTSAFDLPERLAAKRDAALIGVDDEHFAAIDAGLRSSIEEVEERLDALRREPAGSGQRALERDLDIHRQSARLRALRRFGLDACLGRIVHADDPEPIYIGRLGLTAPDGRRLLVDWRSPAAEPFFGATHAEPMGLVSRRRYRWTRGRVSDYWDEVFTAEGMEGHAALDDQSAFIASLGASRSSRMRDVLGTIQADQDAIIRAGSRGALVVDGGPGTGKTVVALHRTAYLLYADPQLAPGRGRVLFVGPSYGYLSYIDDVLPSLGEEGVQTSTLRDLVAEGPDAGEEGDPEVRRLKSSGGLTAAIESAVRLAERPPSRAMTVETPWADLTLTASDWAEAFGAAEPGTPHNEAREQVWEALLEILLDQLRGEREEGEDEFDAYNLRREDPNALLRRAIASDDELVRTFARAWPLLEAADLVARLWSSPDYLARCAPWLPAEAVAALQRPEPRAWTTADLPILDAARLRLGDPAEARARRRREAAIAADRERMDDVLDDLIAGDDSDMRIMSMLRGQDLRSTLVDETALPAVDPDVLAGPFAHIVVDEAQELTDAQWGMLLRRCPSRSFTIVGDRAQARHGFAESWQERLERVGLHEVAVASLSINYRTPDEVMAEAEPVIRAAVPDANVPTSIRHSGVPVLHGSIAELDGIIERWLDEHGEGVACVIGEPGFEPRSRVRSLSAEQAKGLEFDLVVLVRPEAFGEGVEGAVDRYVAMTRATQRLAILR